jgi:hypothetical protein
VCDITQSDRHQKIALLGLLLLLANPQVRTPRPGSTRLAWGCRGRACYFGWQPKTRRAPLAARLSPYESTGGRCPKNPASPSYQLAMARNGSKRTPGSCSATRGALILLPNPPHVKSSLSLTGVPAPRRRCPHRRITNCEIIVALHTLPHEHSRRA